MSGFDDFAEGFAEGFIPVYQRRMAQNEKFENDLLRNKISTWDKEKAATKERDRADAALRQQAKGIVDSVTLPPHIKPEQAMGLVWNELKIYEDPKYVAERFELAIQRDAFNLEQSVTQAMQETDAILTSGAATTRENSISGMNPEFANNLNTAFRELPEDLRGKLTVYSGYRDASVQADIVANNMTKYGFNATDVAAWKSDVASMGAEAAGQKWSEQFSGSGMRKFVALPGSSKHQKGEAADLMFDGVRLDEIDEETRTRIHEHLGKYGLTFRMSHEPWQVELDTNREERPSAITNDGRQVATASKEEPEEEGFLKALGRGFERVMGLDKSYYMTNADNRFKAHLESVGELELYNQVKMGKVLAAPSSTLSYNVTTMNLEPQEPPALSSVNSLDDVDAIRAHNKAFGIQVSPEYNAQLDILETKFQGMPEEFVPIKDITSQGVAINVYETLAGLSDDEKAELPQGYVNTVERLHAAFNDSGSEKLTRSYIATQYFTLKKAADEGGQAEKDALAVFTNSELPMMLEAIEAANPDDPKLPELRDLIRQKGILQSDPKTPQSEIDAIDADIDATLEAERTLSALKEEGEIEVVAIQKDKSWSKIRVNKTYEDGKYVYKDADGNIIDLNSPDENGVTYSAVDEKDWAEHTKIYNAMSKQRNNYSQYATTLVDSMPLAARIYTQVENTPDVTRNAARLGKEIVGAANEVITAVNMLQSIFPDTKVDKTITAAEVADQIDFGALEQVAAGRGLETITSPLARQRAMFEARMILLTFQIGGLEGQRGNAMSNKDFERLQDIFRSTDHAITMQLMREYFQDKINKATALERSVYDTSYEGGSAAAWEERTKIPFFQEGEGVSRLEKLIAGNEQAEAAYKIFTAPVESPIAAPPTQPETATDDKYKGFSIISTTPSK